MNLFTARFLVIFGIICLIFSAVLYWERTNPNRLSFTSYLHNPPVALKSSRKQPVRLIIKGLSIDLPVLPTELSGKEWQTTHEGVSYLMSSPIPGEKGNSILYGHNWNNLLGNLVEATPGDEVEIVYSDNSHKTFTIELTAVISPNQTHILEPSTDSRITLYTCTGFFDSKRFVATAVLH